MTTTDAELEKLEQEINQKKAEEKPVPEPEKVPEPPQPTQEVKPVETQEVTQLEQEVKPEGFDPSDYVKKKGWKTPEDAAQSFRELEKRFHENNQKKADAYQPPQQPYAPQGWPQQPPPPPYGYPQQSYQPPQNPYAPRPRFTEEQAAASYGMTVEDFRRVMALSNDLTEVKTRQLEEAMQKRWEEMNRQSERSQDMTNVFSHPAFSNPDVRAEMHDILSKNQELLNERKPYSAALNQALVNFGMRTITGGNHRSSNYVPTTPPEMAGSKGAGGSLPGKRGLGSLPSVKEAEGKSPEEIEKILKSAGAFKSHMDTF